MSILVLGAKPLPETRRLVVGGPSLGESEMAAWLKQNPASRKITLQTRPACIPVRVRYSTLLVIISSSSLPIIPSTIYVAGFPGSLPKHSRKFPESSRVEIGYLHLGHL